MLIFKQPYMGGEVVPHQDSSFLATHPLSCVGIWLALEDATRDNGCLWTLPGTGEGGQSTWGVAGWAAKLGRAAPGSLQQGMPSPRCLPAGSHLDGVHRRFVRAADGSVSFEGDMPAHTLGGAAFVPVEVAAGSLVLLHGANVHLSRENSSPQSRHAYTMHFVEAAPGYVWQPSNWLQRSAHLPFEPLYDSAGDESGGVMPPTDPAFAHPRGFVLERSEAAAGQAVQQGGAPY
jgi:ectoine hydroxylase-related dioxygenase (phytanoyl-CoA dioxygenase family)